MDNYLQIMNLPKEQRNEFIRKNYEEFKELERRWAVSDYSNYVTYVHDGIFKHHDKYTRYICSYLNRIANGETMLLIIEMPPQHGKTMMVSETFPSYFMGKNEGKSVITASHSDDLVIQSNRRNREKMMAKGKILFNMEVDPQNASVHSWGILNSRATSYARGIKSTITGKPADLFIIDDPYKNREEAESDTIRSKVEAEFESTLSSRIHPGGSLIIINTRWHHDDLTGWILNKIKEDPKTFDNYKKIKRINLPLVCEKEKDEIGRKKGETLWRFNEGKPYYDETWAENKRREVSARTWNSIYQQKPSSDEGDEINIKNFVRYNKSEVRDLLFDNIYQSWDTNFKDSDDGSYVSGQVWGQYGTSHYLLDLFLEHTGFTGTIRKMAEWNNKWGDDTVKIIETKANGEAIIDTLKHRVSNVIGYEPGQNSKLSRLRAVIHHQEHGNVYIPHDEEMLRLDSFIEQMKQFPNGENDDHVDAFSQYLMYASKHTNNLSRSKQVAINGFVTDEELKDMGLRKVKKNKVIKYYKR